MKKIKNVLTIALPLLFILGFLVAGLLLPDKEISQTERRRLQKFPILSKETVSSGQFMKEFESWSLDQFPLRDAFRKLKGYTARQWMGQAAPNGFFEYEGYIIKEDYPINEDSLAHATDRFRFIYDRYLKGKDLQIYQTVIPDKNYFVDPAAGHLSMDYSDFAKELEQQMDYAEYIDILPLLELSDYYATDTHWRQEKLIDVAQKIGGAMEVALSADYRIEKVDTPFFGVYHGQSALSLSPDILYYLQADFLKDCKAVDLETQREFPIYDEEKLESKDPASVADPYEFFLSGPNRAIVELSNPKGAKGRELILFRDSYANAIAPLLLEGYEKITLVDLRRVSPQYLDRFIAFEKQDVLFMQSTLVLNNSFEIK